MRDEELLIDSELLEEVPEEELQEFSLEDILREFSDEVPEETADGVSEGIPEENAPVSESESDALEQTVRFSINAPQSNAGGVTGDTVRLDTIAVAKGRVKNAVRITDEEPDMTIAPQENGEEAFSAQWEPEYEEPMGEYVPMQPIVFHPHSRLRELKRKLVAGPEKRYYELSEKGLGKLQAAIFFSLLIVLLCAASTVLYAMGMVQENRLRLMIFGQFLAMLLSALLGSFQLIEGVADLFRKRFTLNTLLVITFLVCCADGVLCLQQLRVPCCAAFSLEMTMSLWNAYQRRNTEMGMTDTMRKANHLDSIHVHEGYYEDKKGFLRGEGQVEHFTDTYHQPSKPETVLNWYALAALIVSVGIGVAAGVMLGIPQAIQVTAVSLLAAVPATAYICVSRPLAVLERRLHSVGTVLCGWQGVEKLCGKAVFPLGDTDLFPAGTTRMNGVKFYGSREPDEIVAYCTALIAADGGGLTPLFQQVLDSRNGRHYDATNLHRYGNGGIGGEVEGEPVLVGSIGFLKEMGVDVPDGIRVNQAVCVAVDGELCGLFAVTYDKLRSVAAGMATLCAYRGLRPVLITDDFMLTETFIRSRFGPGTKKMLYPEHSVRQELQQIEADPATDAAVLVTGEGLLPFAYGVTGARALKLSARLGVIVHMIGGILGLCMMLTLTILGALELLTPVNMFLYQLVWIIPGLLITEWTRSI